MSRNKTLQTFLQSLSRRFGGRAPSDPSSFKALFERFRNVLNSNNKALETITDMGEKLGGEYLFDIVYVSKAYAQLRQDMQTSLAVFDELTRSRYPRLRDVFAHIDSLVGLVLSESASSPAQPVLFLEDIPWGSAQTAGGKMAQLAEVRNQIGLRVPAGFVITTAAFDSYIRFNGLEDDVRKLQDGSRESLLEELEERILHGKMPPEIEDAVRKATERMRRRHRNRTLAVRSSGEEEDDAYSFAGQFKTVLGVPCEPKAVEHAYRKVMASLFARKAAAYQEQTGYDPGKMKMAVGCLTMLDPVASGVLYSSDPAGDGQTMLISAGWGLGEAIVEAKTGTDVYSVRKGREPEMVRSAVGLKSLMVSLDGITQGTREVPVPEDLRNRQCLSLEQVRALALLGMQIERYFGHPCDVEWALDADGAFWILQARPLRVEGGVQPVPHPGIPDADRSVHPVIIQNRGTVVQRGTAAGKVFIADKSADSLVVPKGAVLVAGHDSSSFIRSMPSLSAIVTETGSPTSHMAALCRELKIPTIVNVPGVLEMLKPGQEVTVVSDDGRSVIYEGIIEDLLAKAGQDRRHMEAVYEFRRKRYLLRYISPLHLIDPLMDDFTPERCRTLHDILRFMHEKAVAELVDQARSGSARLRRRGAVVPLDLPVPAGILVMDMGGGLSGERPGGKVTLNQVTSVPFRAILDGMVHPGAWHAEAVALRAGDFLSSMIRMPDIETATHSTAGYNVAVVSREYVNMSIRFGYHFNMIDCYCSEKARNNHVFFRFAGGATDLTKRSRRLEFIQRVLREYGFSVKIKGDLLIARLAGLPREDMEPILDQTGRLIAYARQLDAVLQDDADITVYTDRFIKGDYAMSGVK